MRDIKNKIRKRIYEQHWTLGFIEGSLYDIIKGNNHDIQYLIGMPRDRWFADPFILDHDSENIIVLVEEYSYKIRRGRIARLIIDRNSYRLLAYKIILDLPTHLSFPFIMRKNNKVYVLPENSASGCWSIYNYDEHSSSLNSGKILLEEPLTDAILTKLMGEERVFTTQVPSPNGNRLQVYSLDGNLIETQLFPSNIARNAGDWFSVGEQLFRPAQDCNGCYGKAVIIQEVVKAQDDSLTFKDICRIESTHPSYTTGCHTFNHYKDLSVIDVHGYRWPTIIKIISSFK